MCGINGIFHFSKSRVVPDELEYMNAKLAQRGPDAEGLYREEQIELGHRRLSIIDISESANQPLVSSNGNLIIVFNGELYNYKEIKNQLPEYSFKTQSDTEVILAAFQKWGEHSLRFMNGIFAFAIWDKTKKELFIARDRLGVKPLYYLVSDDVFMFSSSVRSILETGRSSKKISKASLIDYIRYQTVHAPATLIEDIQCLMPGTFARINEEEGFKSKTYWSINDTKQRSFNSYEQVQEEVRQGLNRAVDLQLVSDVPFGAFLSGGIDSSILVALMTENRNEKTDTFSVVFKEDKFSERAFANLIAKKYKTNHHEIELDVTEFRDLIPEALSFMDHPSADGPNTYVVSKKTREAGVKMALSGLGGDELFGGYSVFNQIPELKSKTWLRSFPAYARKPLGKIYHAIKGTTASSKISGLMGLEQFDTEDIYQFYRQVYLDPHVLKLLSFDSLTPNRVHQITNRLVGYKTAGWGLPDSSKISVAEISTYMQNVLLRDADQMSMASGLEVRVPFLDHELVELVLSVPDNYKNTQSPKKLLVDSFKHLLPEEIYNREKMGFVLPYDIWMRNELKEFCIEKLNWLKESPQFNAREIELIWQKFLRGDKQINWSRIWMLVVLANWMKENHVN